MAGRIVWAAMPRTASSSRRVLVRGVRLRPPLPIIVARRPECATCVLGQDEHVNGMHGLPKVVASDGREHCLGCHHRGNEIAFARGVRRGG